ncbi:acyl-CoA N-acyltransferase [Apodospora peruviana]|uniref:Acyl-CoA N-acyltransferase n=1 Tax=Apodospora peruviana TaxID=516989 RepID=A0AAE0MF63_9PEZI|nr:acyl-CoA N-acyltransferase [Apodospora peruviana]
MPPQWKLAQCTVDDAPALGRNNMAAFWEEPMYSMRSKGKTCEFVIEQATKRSPMRLLVDRHKMRHQKAVDGDGAVVGYCRWGLPDTKTTTSENKPEWPEAQVPAVSAEQYKQFEELRDSAWWGGGEPDGKEELDDRLANIKQRILAERPYMILDYLAVHPDNKGKGIATALVESGIREAERMGIPIFVFAWKSARGIYARLGFREVDRLFEDATAMGGPIQYGAYFMVYDRHIRAFKWWKRLGFLVCLGSLGS